MTGVPTWASGEATSHWADPEGKGTRFRIEHEGFTISGLVLEDGTITNIEIQDSKHVVKKLGSWMFGSRKTLRRGNELVVSNHLILMFERFEFHRHKVAKRHGYRYYRQDFLVPAAWSGLAARECLAAMQVTHTNEHTGEVHEPECTAGTIEYLELIARVIRIHFSKTLSKVERIEMASDVINDLRFWRNHVHYTPGLTLAENFMSRQSFEHCVLGCHSVCLHIKMFSVLCPSQPTDLDETGSDGAEKRFASFGGSGLCAGRRRVYSFVETLNGAGDENQLSAWGSDADPGLRLHYGSAGSHHDAYDHALHELPGVADADLTIYPTPPEGVAAFERGLVSARRRAVARGMSLAGRLPGQAAGQPALTGAQLFK